MTAARFELPPSAKETAQALLKEITVTANRGGDRLRERGIRDTEVAHTLLSILATCFVELAFCAGVSEDEAVEGIRFHWCEYLEANKKGMQ